MASGLVSTLARLDYGLIQLPCPELEYFGAIRKPSTASEMASREYLRRIDDLADRVVETIYMLENSGIEVVALIGVRGSPTCGVGKTHFTDKVRREPGIGLFIYSIINRLKRNFVLLEWGFKSPN